MICIKCLTGYQSVSTKPSSGAESTVDNTHYTGTATSTQATVTSDQMEITPSVIQHVSTEGQTVSSPKTGGLTNVTTYPVKGEKIQTRRPAVELNRKNSSQLGKYQSDYIFNIIQ